MIDTIVMTIPKESYQVINHDKFTPSTYHLFHPPYLKLGGRGYIKCTSNPTKDDKQKYGYLPRLDIIKSVRQGDFPINLRIEFSIPKLLHGNNFDEVEESDFGEICWKLQKLLPVLGVEINDIKAISEAQISAVHYSKNIILDDYTIPYSYIEHFAKVNFNKWLDMNQTDYRNNGHALKCHSNSFEIIMYDKLKDLEAAKKSENNSVENDNYSQLSLFTQAKPKQPFEVLRLEIRIGKRRKLKQLLRKYELESKEMIFRDIYSKEVSQAVLIQTLNDIKVNYPKILLFDVETPNDLILQLKYNNPELSLNKIIQFVGVRHILENEDLREFRVITDHYGKDTWYRLNGKMKKLKIDKKIRPFQKIEKAINDFEKVELAKYQDKL